MKLTMLEGYDPIVQSALGTLFTWGLTAAGAALVFVVQGGNQRKVLDASLGFAAGVMLAASYWSLLAPAIELSEISDTYGPSYSFVPVALGFLLGAFFVWLADYVITEMGYANTVQVISESLRRKGSTADPSRPCQDNSSEYFAINGFAAEAPTAPMSRSAAQPQQSRRRVTRASARSEPPLAEVLASGQVGAGDFVPNPAAGGRGDTLGAYAGSGVKDETSWKRILLLIVAITIHNIPEGLAVGVGFGAVGSTASATFENARNLAIGIGIQNFPEGLAVSLPLKGLGMSSWKSFWYGQLSGMVEPAAGLIGAAAIRVAQPLLPYALAFAAGAMVYVVLDDIIPEAQLGGHGRLCTWSAMVGFVVMMTLDVALG